MIGWKVDHPSRKIEMSIRTARPIKHRPARITSATTIVANMVCSPYLLVLVYGLTRVTGRESGQ